MCVVRLGWLGSRAVIDDGDAPRELSGLVVPLLGSLEATGDLFLQYRLVDGDGAVVEPVAAFFAELAACGRPATTQRSYGVDLLRWFRFLLCTCQDEEVSAACGHAQVNRRDPGQPLGFLPLGAEELECEVEAFDLTEPGLLLGLGAAGQQASLDFVEAR